MGITMETIQATKNPIDYVMKDWHIWSSPDMVTRSLESVLRPEDTYIGPSTRCWADANPAV